MSDTMTTETTIDVMIDLISLAAIIRSSEKYNRESCNKHRLNKYGYDINGCDKDKRDNKDIYDISRNGKEGYGCKKINKTGYINEGINQAKYDRRYYFETMEKLRTRLEQAHCSLKANRFSYAVNDIRVVMEQALRLLVNHYGGDIKNESEDRMLINLKICENTHIIDDSEILKRLHDVRKICNRNAHELDAQDHLNYNKVYFIVMQTQSLLDIIEEKLCPN